jgi:hypothetical protein
MDSPSFAQSSRAGWRAQRQVNTPSQPYNKQLFYIGYIYKCKFDTHALAFIVYRVSPKQVSLKYSLVLMRMCRFEPAPLIVERYHSIVNCAFNMKDLITNNVRTFSK